MGRMKENPRYNVISCRVSDDMKKSIVHAINGGSVQAFIHSALEEKLISERQARMDELLRDN